MPFARNFCSKLLACNAKIVDTLVTRNAMTKLSRNVSARVMRKQSVLIEEEEAHRFVKFAKCFLIAGQGR